VLGRGRLASKQPVCLVRCGTKLLLVSQSADGPRTLTEIKDPEEVMHLTGLCKQAASQNSSATFKQVFAQLGGSRAAARVERGGHVR
jgi:hypothetical protein